MLAEAANSVRSDVVAALQRASAATGTDFNYLLNTAMRESSLKPTAQARTSSAAGLFQFVEQTWLGTVKEHGAKFGLGAAADAITKGSDGRYHTSNQADRTAILALRKDPQTAAYMAGAFSADQRAKLQSGLGRDVCGGELYAAHFLGSDAACRLIQMAENTPSASAAKAFPAAAGANRSVFYNSDGTSKTVAQVYNWALKAHGDASAPLPSQTTAPTVDAQQTTDGRQIYAGNPDTDIRLASLEMDMLTAATMSSSPRASSNPFGDDDNALGGTVPHSPFLMTPGVIDLLTSMGKTPGASDPTTTVPVAKTRAAT
jgi:hypothetical protein